MKHETTKETGGEPLSFADLTVFLLAGGKGSRLLPLTEDCPKPLLPLGGEPMLCRLLRQLAELGCRSAVITSGYLHETLREGVESALGDSLPELRRDYFAEETPLGTAGGVKAAYEKFFDGGKEGREERTFLILGGDAYLERAEELRQAYRFHRERDADLTVLLSRDERPTEFGMASLSKEGKLLTFREKPSWAQVDGDLVSTGMYFLKERIFTEIPRCRYDFGYDLLHRLLSEGLSLYGYALESFWCDVGTPAAYLACNLRESGGKTVCCADAVMEKGADVRASLLLPGAVVEKDATVEGSILGRCSRVEAGATVEKGCVLGSRSVVGRGAKVRSGSTVACRETVDWQNRCEGSSGGLDAGQVERLFGDNCLWLQAGSLRSEICRQIGIAIAEGSKKIAGKGPVRVAVGSRPEAAPLRENLLAGILSGGAEGCDLGNVTAMCAAYLARRARFVCTVYLHYEAAGRFRALFFDENRLYPGMPFERPFRERLRAALPESGVTPAKPKGLRAGTRLYAGALWNALPPLDGRRILLTGDEKEPLAAALRMQGADLRELHGFDISPEERPGEMHLHLEDCGRRLVASEGKVRLSSWQVLALCAGSALREGAGVIALPDRSPEALKRMVRGGGRLKIFSHTCSDARESAARSLAGEESYLTDGNFAAAALLTLLQKEAISLEEAAALLPVFGFAEGETEVDEAKKASLLAAFSGDSETGLRPRPSLDGVLLESPDGGFVRAVAGNGRRLCLMAEAGEEQDAESLLKEAKRFFDGKKQRP